MHRCWCRADTTCEQLRGFDYFCTSECCAAYTQATREISPDLGSVAWPVVIRISSYLETDLHPDPFYKVNSASDTAGACHRGTGPAGYYGAEKTECDAPFSLINATFQWIEDNLKDTIDFVVWTGDSARHDNDEEHPRSEEQVLGLNRKLVEKFREVFGRTDSHRPEIGPFQIPIVPTFGNNDILPHNIFSKGPNTWTKRYSQLWGDIIPEEQRHAFGRGGWFYVEVIPNKLAVFSLNTL